MTSFILLLSAPLILVQFHSQIILLSNVHYLIHNLSSKGLIVVGNSSMFKVISRQIELPVSFLL